MYKVSLSLFVLLLTTNLLSGQSATYSTASIGASIIIPVGTESYSDVLKCSFQTGDAPGEFEFSKYKRDGLVNELAVPAFRVFMNTNFRS